MFWSRPRPDIEADVARVVADAKAGGGLTQADWFRAVARLVVSFDDPHMWVFVPGWRQHVRAGGRFFPLDLRIRGRTVVARSGEGGLRSHPLTAINGVPTGELIDAFRPLAGQADDPYGDEFLALYFPRYLWFFRGWADEFAVTVRDGATDRTVSVPGRTADAGGGKEEPPALTFRELEAGVGVLEFRQCAAGDRIRELAGPVFRAIREKRISRLVVDVRENAGGGDDAWWALLDYLTDKPYSGYSGSRFRVSARLKTLLGEKDFRERYGDDAWAAADGKVFTQRLDPADLRRPGNPEFKYRGAWCVAAGRRTFSSAMSFVCAVKAYGLAPVVGEETGGRVKGFGMWVPVKLPRTGLEVAVSTKEFVGSVDVPYRRGVPPDVEVSTASAADPDPVILAGVRKISETGAGR
jgi:hypothetical protein